MSITDRIKECTAACHISRFQYDIRILNLTQRICIRNSLSVMPVTDQYYTISNYLQILIQKSQQKFLEVILIKMPYPFLRAASKLGTNNDGGLLNQISPYTSSTSPPALLINPNIPACTPFDIVTMP